MLALSSNWAVSLASNVNLTVITAWPPPGLSATTCSEPTARTRPCPTPFASGQRDMRWPISIVLDFREDSPAIRVLRVSCVSTTSLPGSGSSAS